METVNEGSTLEKAGLLPGDILFSYQRLPKPPANPRPASGVLKSAVDWDELVVNQSPRGTVRLLGRRGDSPIEIEVSGGSWEARIRPFLFSSELKSYEQSRQAVATGNLEQSEALLLSESRETEKGSVACWLLTRIGEDWSLARRWREAQDAYLRALASVSCHMRERLLIYDALGHVMEGKGQVAKAEKYYRKPLKARASSGKLSLNLAKSYANISRCAWSRKDLAGTESRDKIVLHIRERLAPDSLDLARTLFNLGALKLFERHQKEAEGFITRGLKISEISDPDGLHTANALSNLGILSEERGRLDEAVDYHTRALKIREKKAPGSAGVAASLSALGTVCFDKRRLDEAQDYYKRALLIARDLATERDLEADLLGNLGLICVYRREFDRAEDYLLQAIKLKRAIAPDNLGTITSLDLLAKVELSRGHQELAERYLKEVLRITRRDAPGTIAEAGALSGLGEAAFKAGLLDVASRYYSRALSINERTAPRTLNTANGLFNLAGIAGQQGKGAEAIRLLTRALKIEELIAPNTDVTAATLYRLGVGYRLLNQPLEAAKFLYRSLESLEAQIPRLGGTLDVQSNFRERDAPLFSELVDLLVQLNHPLDAFQVLERSRGHELLEMLAQRNLPPPPMELDRKYNNVQRRLLEVRQGKAHGKLDSLLHELRQSWAEREEAIEAIQGGQSVNRPFRYPVPLDFASLQRAIDPGTLVLSYSIGQTRSHVFTYGTDTPLEILPIDVGETEIRGEIDEFRNLVLQTRNERSPEFHRRSLLKYGSKLYNILIRPVEARIQGSQRVLIIPDGPLQSLPWAALVRETEAANGIPRYFGEWKSLHVVLSGMVYAEVRLRRDRQSERTDGSLTLKSIAAFGAPSFPRNLMPADLAGANIRVRAIVEHGFDFSPLPGARDEIQRIAKIFPDQIKIYVDAEAREEDVKSLPQDVRILHFATHTTLDDSFPLNSAVVLSIPEKFEDSKDDGLLQAWEIFEQVRLDADLVVLSACESGLGKEMGGEGLIGLTRAFQYAGARSVMASLWKISDRTTAELMVRFYKHLKDGLPKDEALRAAQMELIHGPIQVKRENGEVEEIDASAPYYWAAFQIYGDWQ